ncbi:MAG: type II 3-dehydroquinate dehydratase [Bacteroidales bacterium]|nr:type II 3-dehydroquinate dehydratase [Bacteroidales bacterium]
MTILILNGPNLNLTGRREPEVYGVRTFDDLLVSLKQLYAKVKFVYFQSNIEGELIDKLHEYGFSARGIILNAGAYTHTSVAIGDAVKAIESPVIEVHLSNVFTREEFRHHSFISPNAKGYLCGFGLYGYLLAAESLINDFRLPETIE